MSINLSALQKQRRDTAANWTAENPTLLAGEIGLESDTGYWKVGDGATAWTSLAYVTGLGAEIPVSRLADGTARQLLQTAANGTDVEWTSNVDVPGTLDVTGAATFDAAVTIQGDLTVNGTTTTIDTQNLIVEDKNVIIGNVTTPTDVTADGGGITLKGTTDKTINWVDATDAWTLSEHVNIASGKEYRIDGTKVLDATSLGSSVLITSANITDGTIVNGDINASAAIAGTKISPDFGSQNRTSTGTSTAASFIPTSSTAPTNGVYLPAANSVAISTGGSGRLFVDSSGRLGVGTSSPSGTVHAYNAGGLTSVVIGGDAASSYSQVQLRNSSAKYNWSLSAQNNVDNGFEITPSTAAGGSTFSTPAVVVKSDGKVGIGVTSPGSLLHTSAASDNELQIQSTGSGGSGNTRLRLRSGTSTTTYDYYLQGDAGGDFRLYDAKNSTDRLRVDTSGRLLVGTSSARTNVVGQTPNLLLENTGGSILSAINNQASGNDAQILLGKTRGTSVGSNTIVQSDDAVGLIAFCGNDGTQFREAATIRGWVDGTPGANDMPGRLVFSTTADGASSPSERWRIDSSGSLVGVSGSAFVAPYVYNTTTATAANVNVDATGFLRRSTSSIKYKTNVETIQDQYADAILGCRPVWYQSTCEADKPEWGHWGFIAEEVAEIDPRLCFFKEEEDGTLEPEGVQYDRFVPHLLNLIKRQGEAIAELQAEVAALKVQ